LKAIKRGTKIVPLCSIFEKAQFLAGNMQNSNFEWCADLNNAPNFIQGDVRSIDFGEGYDAAIIMFQSFGYFSDSEDKLVLPPAGRRVR
jgi:hypothetical protein